MRRLLLIAAVLLLALPAYPWGGAMMVAGGGTPAGGGTTLSSTGTTTGYAIIGTWENKAVGFPFRPSVSGTITSGIVRMAKASGDAGTTLTLSIYTNNAGVPGSLVGTASNAVGTDQLPTGEGDMSFSGMSAEITSGTDYWGVVIISTVNGYGGTISAVDTGTSTLVNLTSVGGNKKSSNGTDWVLNSTREVKFSLTGN